MSLREEMVRYEHLTGKSAEPITINRLCAFLDGVDRGIAELEKVKAEFEDKILLNQTVAMQIIDNHISELKGENKQSRCNNCQNSTDDRNILRDVMSTVYRQN